MKLANQRIVIMGGSSDDTYEKEGRANLFIAYEPLAGKRLLKVTEQRTKIE